MDFEFMNGVYETFMEADISQYAFLGSKTLAVILFVAVMLKKYAEGAVDTDGVTWGLRPQDLIKGLVTIILVIYSPQILDVFDTMLAGLEEEFAGLAPPVLPLMATDVEIEVETADSSMGALFNLFARFFNHHQMFTSLMTGFLGMVFWVMDFIIYPFFLAERFFMLGVLKVFFPFVMALSVVEKYRVLGYNFFKLYAAVYLLAPAFFLVNLFSNELYGVIQTDMLNNIFGMDINNSFLRSFTATATTAFVLFVKWKLYKRSSSFVFKIFTT